MEIAFENNICAIIFFCLILFVANILHPFHVNTLTMHLSNEKQKDILKKRSTV